MKILFRVLLFLFFLNNAIVFGQATSILNIKTNSNDCIVFINDNKVGTGKSINAVLKRDAGIHQIRVDREGYKSEYYVAFPSEPSLEVKCTHRIALLPNEIKSVAIRSLNADFSDYFGIERLGLTYNDFKRNSFLYVTEPKLCKKEIFKTSYDNEVIDKVIQEAIVNTGFVDTIESILAYRNHDNFIDIEVLKVRIYVLNSSTGLCEDVSVFMEGEVKMEIFDRFLKSKSSVSKTSRSGVYALNKFNWYAPKEEKKQSLFIGMVLKDLVANAFLSFVHDTAEVKIFEEEEPLKSKGAEALILKSTNYVTDLKSAMKATVSIKSENSFGSGCVVSDEGYVLTSYHVVSENFEKKKDVLIIMGNGDTLSGKVVRTSRKADLALIKANGKFPIAFKIVSNPEFDITDQVFAIGTPSSLELNQTVSRGIISAIREEKDLPSLVQTDVSVSPGNSGGPLIKAPNIFVGVVNSKIYGRRVEGLSFCTPAKNVIEFLNIQFK